MYRGISRIKRFGISSLRLSSTQSERASVVFAIPDKVGALEDILGTLRKLNISLTRIESRPSRTKGDYDMYVDFVAKPELVTAAMNEIKGKSKEVRLTTSGDSDSGVGQVPWFPRKIADLDTFAEKVLSYGAELDADHPGFKDPAYRARRKEITELAFNHKHGMQLARVEYTKTEVETWGVIYKKLSELYKTHACYEHQYIFRLLEQNCGYRPDNIPQIADVSKFLQDCTGFTIRPVMGLLTSRDFLNALAFRVFFSTQYIRHHSAPFYTPEPDVCHELLGHVPLYADPDFAAFSHEVGLASLGASDEDLTKLARIYWYTVEFGLVRQNGEKRAFGAGLLSSFGELEYCLTDKPEFVDFSCEKMAALDFPITKYQPLYFVAESFKQMKDEVREYASGFSRPFALHYDASKQAVEILDTKSKLIRYANGVKGDMTRLISAIDKFAK